MKGEFRIVINMAGDVCVQKHNGGLMNLYHPCHLCKGKNAEGLAEAQEWLKDLLGGD